MPVDQRVSGVSCVSCVSNADPVAAITASLIFRSGRLGFRVKNIFQVLIGKPVNDIHYLVFPVFALATVFGIEIVADRTVIPTNLNLLRVEALRISRSAALKVFWQNERFGQNVRFSRSKRN